MCTHVLARACMCLHVLRMRVRVRLCVYGGVAVWGTRRLGLGQGGERGEHRPSFLQPNILCVRASIWSVAVGSLLML